MARLSAAVPPPVLNADADPPAYAAVREGAPLVAALAGAGALAVLRSRPAGAGILALAAWAAWFFRDPVRVCPAEPGTLYAAADGRIVDTGEVEWDWFVEGRALRIATFLSPLDVHVNRSPAAARLVASRRDPGGFAPAFLSRRATGNARQLLGLVVDRASRPAGPAAAAPDVPTSPATHPRATMPSAASGTGTHQGATVPSAADDRLVVAQIVGIAARRIVSWRLPGDTLRAGEKLGMIRFGSRTDVLIPAGVAQPLVSPGDTVRAGLTPIARYLGTACRH